MPEHAPQFTRFYPVLLTPCLPAETALPEITIELVTIAKPTNRRYFLWDTKAAGFGLSVSPSGVKSFVYQYRNKQGRTRRATIGKATGKKGVLAPREARDKAREMAEAVRAGRDPLAEKRKARGELTVAGLLDLYTESEDFKAKARSTREVDLGRINNHLKPTLGAKHITTLSRSDVQKAKAKIKAGSTARDEKAGWRARSIVKGGEGAAQQSIRLLSAALKWAVADDHIDLARNVAQGVAESGYRERDITMSGADDYARLFSTLDAMERDKRIRAPVADIFRLLALTGARRDEIAGLVWSEVDLEKSLITIPPERHKTGRRTRKARQIGLSNLAAAILERQPKGNPSDLVFPPTRSDDAGRSYPKSRKDAPGRISLRKSWLKVREKAKLPAGIGLHGLRHSLATMMALEGAQASDIMATLGHARLSTSQRYVHHADNVRKALAERAATLVTAGIGARE